MENKMKASKCKLTLIRHGQVPGNIDRRFIGVTNEPLTPEGAAAIRVRAEAREYPEADLIFASPMLRCLQTSDIIYPGQKIIVVDNLKEMNFGIFENKNHAELDGSPEYQAWLDAGGRQDFPGGEPIDEFCDRVMQGLEEVKKLCADYLLERSRDENCREAGSKSSPESSTGELRASMIVHGGTIMAIQSRLGICDFYDKMFNNGDYREIEIEL